MNTVIITGKLKLVAAVSLIALASIAMPAQAEQGLGGLGGAVGGVVGGFGNAVGGLGFGGATNNTVSLISNDEGKDVGVSLGGPDGVNADVGLNAKKSIKAKLKLTVGGTKARVGAKVLGDKSKIVGAKTKVGLGGPSALKAKVGTTVRTDSVGVKVGLSAGNNDGGGGDDGGISHEIAGLSSYERLQLKRKCAYVLSSPASFNRDAVQVCRVLAGL